MEGNVDANSPVDTNSPREKFLSLPTENQYCRAVDTEHGLWIDCGLCKKRIKTRTDNRSPFNLTRWNEHLKSIKHIDNVGAKKDAEVNRLKQKRATGTLTRLEKSFLEMHTRTQTDLDGFFAKKPRAENDRRRPPSSSSREAL